MNETFKYALFFLGGVAVGAIGAVAVSRGKLDVKPLAADLLSRGMDVKEALARKVAAVKEDMEDLAAEARAAQEQRKGA
ncbi:hypothetical protein [uncultured Desulfovibrio sp.]|uniref:hypothetical protein n=1 Tax=uncultured Desulfovibrio sp. TaxID=167968 RepID=UPI001C3A63B2|nr:hypothetical protein [uncultured Desulfovibrio sp.]MDM8215601.1 hypothetical protein [Desulfovibrio piger]HIX40106.1 DUF5132 domain-containing protein [Candidatus Desulfovibrio intestinigallinarum]